MSDLITSDAGEELVEGGGHETGLREAWGNYVDRVRGGELGSLPAVLGLIALLVLFTVLKGSTFLSAFNMANLLSQAAMIIVIAMGLIFVLLLGEIDLAAGYTAGTTGAILACCMSDSQSVPAAPAAGASRLPGHGRDHRPVHGNPGRPSRDPVLRRDLGDVPRTAGTHAADHRRRGHHPGP